MSGRFLGHEPCPSCGSRDNVGVWDNGKWCFGCGWRQRAETTVAAVERLREGKKLVDNVGVNLPEDAQRAIGVEAQIWLRRFQISPYIAERHDAMWSPSKRLLIFPLFDQPPTSRRLVKQVGDYKEDGLLAWQGRYFGPDTKHPKYVSEGKLSEVIDLHGDIDKESVFVVEDKVSAIKLGMLECAMPLWGSHVGDKRADYLSRRFLNLFIWLDPDKKKEALKQALTHSHRFRHVGVIYSDRDPKEYPYSEIRNIIDEHIKQAPAVDTGG